MQTCNHTVLEQIVRDIYESASGCHDWEHTRRVCELAKTIAVAEQADLTVVTAAALLHDIGRCGPDAKNKHVCHAQTGARQAKPILDDFYFSSQQKENILHCIAAHRFRRPPAPATLEAKVIFDADKLDAIGAVGIARAYLFAGELGAVLHNPDIDVAKEPSYSSNDTGYREFLVKLQYVKARMLTDQGKKMAMARHDFMDLFFSRFLKEYEGQV